MGYALTTLWHERQRFLPGILAVAFSAVLIALQCGLLLGMFSFASLPVDHTRADIWLGSPDLLSVDLGRPVPQRYLSRLAGQPEVERCETYLQGFTYWAKPGGGQELCMVIGSRMADDSLGGVRELTPELRALLTEPGTVVVDAADLGRLGVRGVGDGAEISGRRVRVVGLVQGLRGLVGCYVFCSCETARTLLPLAPEQTTYLLARCHDPADAPAVVARLQGDPEVSVFTSAELSRRSRVHWLTKTSAGIALGCAAALGLLVGAVVTSQTLYAGTAACLREYAVLWALGIPRWRMAAVVLGQAFWVGAAGVGLALPAVFALARAAAGLGALVLLPAWLLELTAAVTMGMALLSGLAALRSLRLIEPAVLLR
jgi:putative ABC transport system permease protein